MKRKRKTKNHADYKNLEDRKLLASLSIQTVNGVETLVIDGTSLDDIAIVREVSNTQVAVTHGTRSSEQPTPQANPQQSLSPQPLDAPSTNGNPMTTLTFNKTDFDRIRFLGRNGDDQFDNQTDIDSAAFGHDGDDVLRGGDGHNWIQGGDGNDDIYGGPKNDMLRGRAGDDFIDAGKRHDRIYGGSGSDTINAGAGRDRVFAEAGNDKIWGGSGNDRIKAGPGNDRVDLGSGSYDVITFDQAFARYSVEAEGPSLRDLRSSDGIDSVTNADLFRFGDRDATPTQISIDLSAVESRSMELVNQARTSNGLQPLTLKRDLFQFANNVAQHRLSPLGRNPDANQLANRHSVQSDIQHLANQERTTYRENFSYLVNQQISVDTAANLIHNSFMNSQTHRDNILAAGVTEIGVGIFKNSNGWYVVHSFFET